MNRIFYFILTVFLFVACSPEEAHVDGNPPQIRQVNFKANSLKGQFSLLPDKPGTVFLWPDKNAKGNPISREEEVEVRTTVVIASETIDVVFAKIAELAGQIGELTQQFVAAKCGLYEDTIFDPDPNSPSVDDWIEPDPDVPGQG